MTILTSAYDTTACRSYNKAKIHDPLVALFLMGGTTGHFGGKVQAVEIDSDGAGKVNAFNYPFIDERDNSIYSFTDLRSLTSYDPRAERLRIRNQTEYTSKLIVANIAHDWALGYTERFLLSLPLGLAVYSSWMGECINNRFPTDALTQLKVSVFAAILYVNNFYKEERIAQRDHKTVLQSLITRHCEYSHPEVATIIEEYYTLSDIESFCTAVQEYTQNVRLKDLNVATLFEAAGGYWVGNEGREMMAVSLEYPPVWLGVLLSSLTDRGYRNTKLSRITERSIFKKKSEQFIRTMLAKGIETE